MTPRHCRTCGFTDCPGARGGDCPRWPARDRHARVLAYEIWKLGREPLRATETAPAAGGTQ